MSGPLTSFEEWKAVQPPPRPLCEFDHSQDKPTPATVYGGYGGANDWAGYACDRHAEMPGFRVWDRLRLGWTHGTVEPEQCSCGGTFYVDPPHEGVAICNGCGARR